jgi:hypothetical protein
MTTPPLVLAPPEKIRQLQELRARKAERDRLRLAQVDAFQVLGYEPTCLPRREAIKAGAEVIPERCGKCPQEQFHAATEEDVLYGRRGWRREDDRPCHGGDQGSGGVSGHPRAHAPQDVGRARRVAVPGVSAHRLGRRAGWPVEQD